MSEREHCPRCDGPVPLHASWCGPVGDEREGLRRRRKHWYFISHVECQNCSGETFRERRYGRRPKLWKNRNEYVHGGICYRCSYEMFMG